MGMFSKLLTVLIARSVVNDKKTEMVDSSPILDVCDSGSSSVNEDVISPKRSMVTENYVSSKPQDGVSAWEAEELGKEFRAKKQIRLAFTHLGLMLSLVIYGLMGGAIFQALEQQNETDNQHNIVEQKEELLRKVSALNYSEPNYHYLLYELITTYEGHLDHAVASGISISNVNETFYNKTTKWDYWSSVFFAGTVFTTIGYGHLAPKTTGGRVAMIIYGTIGIPLCLIVLSDAGSLISKGLRHLMCGFLRLKKCCRKEEKHGAEEDEELTPETLGAGSVLLVLLGCIIAYMFVVAAVYISWETEWDYFTSFYFLFVSVSTVGFGDVLPDHPNFFMISIVLIFLGIALFSTVFTVVGDLIRQSIKKATREIDEKLGIRNSEKTENDVQLKPMKTSPSTDQLVSKNHNEGRMKNLTTKLVNRVDPPPVNS